MEDKIKKILKEAGESQVNLCSDVAVDMLTKKITKIIKQHDVLNFGPHKYDNS